MFKQHIPKPHINPKTRHCNYQLSSKILRNGKMTGKDDVSLQNLASNYSYVSSVHPTIPSQTICDIIPQYWIFVQRSIVIIKSCKSRKLRDPNVMCLTMTKTFHKIKILLDAKAYYIMEELIMKC